MGIFRSIINDALGIFAFSGIVLREIVKPPFRFSLLYKEIEFCGMKSIPIIFITATFLGMVFTLHSIRAFSLARMESLVGPSVVLSFARELASGFSALIITGRVGSAYCSKIGTMKITIRIFNPSFFALSTETMPIAPLFSLIRFIACSSDSTSFGGILPPPTILIIQY